MGKSNQGVRATHAEALASVLGQPQLRSVRTSRMQAKPRHRTVKRVAIVLVVGAMISVLLARGDRAYGASEYSLGADMCSQCGIARVLAS